MSPGVGVFGIVVTSVELMAVFVGYQYGVTQWQPMFVLLIELVAYTNSLVNPDADLSLIHI